MPTLPEIDSDLCRLLLSQATGIFLALAPNGELLYESTEASLLESSAPAVSRALRDAAKHALSTGIAETSEVEESNSRGAKVWYRCTSTPVRDARGRISAAAVQGFEITLWKGEAARTRSILEAVAEGTSDAIFAKDLEGRYTMVNSAGAKLAQRDKSEIIGKTDFDFLPRKTAEAFTTSDRTAIELGKVRTYEETGSLSGAIMTLQSTKGPYCDSSGKVIGVIGISRDITETKRLISLLRATLESTADGILVVNQKGTILDFNKRLLEIWHLPATAVRGHSYLDAAEEVADLLEHPEECRRKLKEIFNDPDRESFDILRFKDGSVLERYSRPQKIERETVGRVFSYRDISERTRAEESLRESELRKRTIFDSAMDSVISMDRDGKIREFNPAAEAQFGIKAQDAIGKDLADQIIPERFRERHRNGLRRYLTTREGPVIGRRLELPALRHDGSEFPAEISITVAQVAGVPVFTGFVRDLTERRGYQDVLEKQAQRLKSLADASRSFAEIRLELSTTLEVAAKILGETCDSGTTIRLLGKEPGLEIVASHHPNEAIRSRLQQAIFRGFRLLDDETLSQVLNAKRPLQIELSRAELLKHIRPDFWPLLDELRVRSWTAVPLQISGQAIGVFTLMSEKPARPFSAEEQDFLGNLADRIALAIDNAKLYAQAQDAIRLRDEFILTASHELRTPLTPLKLHLQLLSNFIRAGKIVVSTPDRKLEQLLHAIDISEQSVSRMVRLVEDMLAVAQMGARELALTPSQVDLTVLIETVAKGLRPELLAAHAPLELSLDPHIEGQWDRARLEQVVSNLLMNAIKFGAGSRIRIELSATPERARLVVRDLGIGIAKEDQRRVFKRFERAVSSRYFGGLGLGLYITRQIVEAHGGRIALESSLGTGTAVIVELPFHLPSEKKRAPAA